MGKKRAMSSEVASRKKLQGHERERTFANLINGQVNKGRQTSKMDVVDLHHRRHSVKSGKFWQIFLYRRERLKTNSVFRGLKLSILLVDCLDAFPENRKEYLADKHKSKIALQEPMRKLCGVLQDRDVLESFFDRALFNSGEVNYLSILHSDGTWHIFPKKLVLDFLLSCDIVNSKARNSNEYSDQKVLVKIDGRNLGEIELRNDSDIHYREVKFRINGGGFLLPTLIEKHKDERKLVEKENTILYLYATAINDHIIKEA